MSVIRYSCVSVSATAANYSGPLQICCTPCMHALCPLSLDMLEKNDNIHMQHRADAERL